MNVEKQQKCLLLTNEINKICHPFHDVTRREFNILINDSDYGKLITLRENVIPYIFYFLEQNGYKEIYFLLLEINLYLNPIPKQYRTDRFYQMFYWLKWYVESGNYDKFKNFFE